MTATQLLIWSPSLGEGLACPLNEITWLDRRLLSAGSDPSLHRAPRCAGIRYLDHGWELFSHDNSHEVYVAPNARKRSYDHEQVRAGAVHLLPAARGRFEPYPLRLDNGPWLVSVGKWVLTLDVRCPGQATRPATADNGTATHEHRSRTSGSYSRSGQAQPLPGAAAKVRAYFERKDMARIAIAYYYQEFVLGSVGPQEVPIMDVSAALDLTGEAAVSEYKKELQRLIWNEQGHQRHLAEFLIASDLISRADVELANVIAAANARSGKAAAARARLRYRQKNAPATRRRPR